MAWTSPRTWVAGEVVTAALLNTHVRDNLKTIGDAWGSYTPTLTNGSNGNGTLTGAYTQAGKLTFFRIVWTLGSTSSISGILQISLPVTAIVNDFLSPASAYLNDLSDGTDSGRRVFGTALLSSGTTIAVQNPTSGARVAATVPWTWATGDKIGVQGMYEAA